MSDASNFRCPSLSESLVERHKASQHLYLLAHYWYSSSDIHFLLSVPASHWDLSPVILCKLTSSLLITAVSPCPPVSCFSHVWLFATLWTVTHQAPLRTGILQARILEWVAMLSSRGPSWPRDRSYISLCLLHWQAGSLPPAPPEKPQVSYHIAIV